MARKSKTTRKRYTPEQKAKILAAAKAEDLTGAQAAKKFGISMLTFYKWRGPVRGRKRRGRPAGKGKFLGTSRVRVKEAAIRKAVRAQIQKLLPRLIREEVEAALR